MTSTKPDLYELFKDREFKKIEAILDSAEYTRDEKIVMILGQSVEAYQSRQIVGVTQRGDFFFLQLCVYYRSFHRRSYQVPIELTIKVLRILGETLGNYVDELKTIITENRNVEDKANLLKVIIEEADVLTSLLLLSFAMEEAASVEIEAKIGEVYCNIFSSESRKQNILEKVPIRYFHDGSTERTKNIFLCDEDYDASDTDYVFYKHATLLEIALHKHVDIEVIRDLVRIGGKDLLLLSDRSLIQGAIIEDNHAVEIVKLFLEVGGKDLVMTEKCWHEHDANLGLNLFEYLSLKKELLCNCTTFWVFKIMNMLIDTGKEDLVMKKNKKGQSILHHFQYFHCNSFLPVIDRITSIGGKELLSSKDDNGDTVLHTLARFYPQNKSDLVVDLKWWEVLACDKDLVFIRNRDGKTALHIACENSEVNAIKVLVQKGGRDLVWKKDNQMNTALHLLSFRVSREKDADNFQAFKHIIKVGGKKLLHSLNNKEKKPLTPFFMQALEFEFDEENKRAKFKKLQEKNELDKRAKLNLEEELKKVQKKNEDLQWKWINRKKTQRSEKELEEEVKSMKKKLKAQKKDMDVLNGKNEELQKERESQLMNEKTNVDSNNLLKDVIKRLQGTQHSLDSKIKEQQRLVKNLQDERKQADLEFEIVKTMHEEQKTAYETSLVEIRQLKEAEKSQQDDIRHQNEMNLKLQTEMKEKDDRIEVYESKLRDLEEDNQRLRHAENNLKQLLYLGKPAPMKVEENNGEVDETLNDTGVQSLEEEIQTLQDTIKEQRQIAEEKQKENNMLKNENERLNDKIVTSCMKRSREEETEEIDCIEEEDEVDEEDVYSSPSKRGKTATSSSESRASDNARTRVESLEAEVEELIDQLENEKANHSKTLKRLKEARRVSKNN